MELEKINFLKDLVLPIISGVLGGFILYIILRLIKASNYPSHSKKRTHLLVGKWKGYLEQKHPQNETELIQVPLEIILKKSGKIIHGRSDLHSPFNNDIAKLIFTNGMFDGIILKMDYQNEDKSIFQRGSAIIRMNGQGKVLNGRFVGYSPINDKIINSTLHLEHS